MIKTSIIIAAYNIEEYIGRCIESCINQTYKDIEVIVVNDGSTDNTLDIINSFKDDRIVVVNQKNKGLVEARKSGFNVAKGEYILFVDGDDWIKENTISKLLETVEDTKYDIICYKWLFKYDNGNEEKGFDRKIEIEKGESLLDLLFTKKIGHSLCSKFIRREFIIDNKIEFPNDFSYGEDLAFVYAMAICNPKFTVIDDYLYYYYQRENSLSFEINNKTSEIVKALEFVRKQFEKNNLYNKYREEFEYMCFMQSYYIRKNYIFNNRNEVAKNIHKSWRSLKININANNNKFYKKLYETESKKALILEGICKRNYFLGYLYYALRK